MIKVQNWWFLDDDPNRKNYADSQWGEAKFNIEMTNVIDSWFKNKPKTHAIDIGANVGFMTAYFGNQWSKTTAFEPTPSVFECLKLNCTRDNIELKNLAVSDTTQDLLFAVSNRTEINQIISSTDVLKKHWSSITVPAITLDSLNLDDVDMLKIDVEGHELSVVKGAEHTIKHNKPLIAIEISFENKVLDKKLSLNHHHALQLLQEWGYKIIWTHSNNFDFILEPT